MHVVIRIQGCRVEVQVRTIFQHKWAMAVEGLADRWGRQIRYGEDPLDRGRLVEPGLTRLDAWGEVLRTAEAMSEVERLIDRLQRMPPVPTRPLLKGLQLRVEVWQIWRTAKRLRRTIEGLLLNLDALVKRELP